MDVEFVFSNPKNPPGSFLYEKKIFLGDIAIGKECREMFKISAKWLQQKFLEIMFWHRDINKLADDISLC